MTQLKKMVSELFDQDSQVRSIEKDIKAKRAHYHHLILKNSEKIFSDDEVLSINTVFQELKALEQQKSSYSNRMSEIKDYLKSLLEPLNGGKWIHETSDPIHPRWEFWVEDGEIKYARLNGLDY